ncbi:MAG: hypothetical protein ABGW68_00040, partial [Gammaproteobacteria bacterium]
RKYDSPQTKRREQQLNAELERVRRERAGRVESSLGGMVTWVLITNEQLRGKATRAPESQTQDLQHLFGVDCHDVFVGDCRGRAVYLSV